MAGEWRKALLSELTINHDGRRKPVKESERRPGPYPYYGASGVVDYVDDYLFDGDYLLIAEDGENLRTRQTPIAFMARGKSWVNNHAHVVTGNGEADTRFLMYAIQGTDISAYLTGAVMPKLTQGNLGKIELNCPPLKEQRAIAHILGTLDDKIELNRRQNETLVAMARALFRAWFMDFEPVRAKMEGRWRRGESLPGLPAHLYDLFPDHFVESELGEIPEGWKLETLGDHFDAVKGVSYKGSGLCDSGLPLHNLNSIYEGGGYKYEGIKYYAGEYADRHVVRPGDVIVANTEQGHDRLLIGYAAIVPRIFGAHGIASHHIYRMRPRPNGSLTAAFLCHLLNSPRIHDVVSGYANGTTVNMLPIDGVQKPQIVLPPRPLVTVFDSLASNIEQRREEMVLESRTLAALRDRLLPKLISGELRVKDAEAFLKERRL